MIHISLDESQRLNTRSQFQKDYDFTYNILEDETMGIENNQWLPGVMRRRK